MQKTLLVLFVLLGFAGSLIFAAPHPSEPTINPIESTLSLAKEIAQDGQSAVILGALIVVLMIVLLAVIVWLPRTLFRILERNDTRHSNDMRELHAAHALERAEFLSAITELRDSMHTGLTGVTDRLVRLEITKEMKGG
jgi:hypothetical protein